MISLFVMVLQVCVAQSQQPDLYQRLNVSPNASQQELNRRVHELPLEIFSLKIINQHQGDDIFGLDAVFLRKPICESFNDSPLAAKMNCDDFILSLLQTHARNDEDYFKSLQDAAFILRFEELRKVYDPFRLVLNNFYLHPESALISPEGGINAELLMSYEAFNAQTGATQNIDKELIALFEPEIEFGYFEPEIRNPKQMTLPQLRVSNLARSLVLLTHFSEAIKNLVDKNLSVEKWIEQINVANLAPVVDQDDLKFLAKVLETLFLHKPLRYHQLIADDESTDRRFLLIRFLADLIGKDSELMRSFLESTSYHADYVEAKEFLDVGKSDPLYMKLYKDNVMGAFLKDPQFDRFRDSGCIKALTH